jgi:hypothetical protein
MDSWQVKTFLSTHSSSFIFQPKGKTGLGGATQFPLIATGGSSGSKTNCVGLLFATTIAIRTRSRNTALNIDTEEGTAFHYDQSTPGIIDLGADVCFSALLKTCTQILQIDP